MSDSGNAPSEAPAAAPAPAAYVPDVTTEYIPALLAIPTAAEMAISAAHRPKPKNGPPKRAKNSFILYRTHFCRHADFIARLDAIKASSNPVILPEHFTGAKSKILGAHWNAAKQNPEVFDFWQTKWLEEQQAHAERYPDYVEPRSKAAMEKKSTGQGGGGREDPRMQFGDPRSFRAKAPRRPSAPSHNLSASYSSMSPPAPPPSNYPFTMSVFSSAPGRNNALHIDDSATMEQPPIVQQRHVFVLPRVIHRAPPRREYSDEDMDIEVSPTASPPSPSTPFGGSTDSSPSPGPPQTEPPELMYPDEDDDVDSDVPMESMSDDDDDDDPVVASDATGVKRVPQAPMQIVQPQPQSVSPVSNSARAIVSLSPYSWSPSSNTLDEYYRHWGHVAPQPPVPVRRPEPRQRRSETRDTAESYDEFWARLQSKRT